MLPHRPAEINMEDYARFLPPDRRKPLVPPVSDWWPWTNHQVHLLRLRDASAPVRMLVVHGAGAHGAALWPVASLLAGRGVDVSVVDLPLYGRTVTVSPGTVTYQDWVALLVDLISAEDDGRPVILFGASIGGLLAVEAAARSGNVAAVVATCLLDPRERDARSAMTRFGPVALLFMPMLRLVWGPLARIQSESPGSRSSGAWGATAVWGGSARKMRAEAARGFRWGSSPATCSIHTPRRAPHSSQST
ncbi:alpha/beta hydrolase [Arthrobacter sp. D1-29]